MQSAAKLALSLLALAALHTACRNTLPPTEPSRTGEAPPGTRTNDAPIAGPLAGDSLGSPGSPGSPGSGGSSTLPLPSPSSGGSSN